MPLLRAPEVPVDMVTPLKLPTAHPDSPLLRRYALLINPFCPKDLRAFRPGSNLIELISSLKSCGWRLT